MKGRGRTAAAFVASLALVMGCLGAWATRRDIVIGAELEQVTVATESVATDSVATGSEAGGLVAPAGPERAQKDLPGRDSTQARKAPVPVVDATRIPALDDVVPPLRLSIPSLDLEMPVTATGVGGDGQMELPDDPRVVGWYRFGALPGDPVGSAVLGGHVDSERHGAGPLARLASVDEGARIEVAGADGRRTGYEVASVERISKAALPVDRLFDPTVPHRLVLVTCGGAFLPAAGGYQDNIVVIAEPT